LGTQIRRGIRLCKIPIHQGKNPPVSASCCRNTNSGILHPYAQFNIFNSSIIILSSHIKCYEGAEAPGDYPGPNQDIFLSTGDRLFRELPLPYEISSPYCQGRGCRIEKKSRKPREAKFFLWSASKGTLTLGFMEEGLPIVLLFTTELLENNRLERFLKEGLILATIRSNTPLPQVI